MVDWTKAEYLQIGQAIADDKSALVLDDGIFKLKDIRAIVLIPEPEVEETEEKPQEGGLTEWGFVDPETAAWLKAQGVDVSKGVND